MNNLQQIMLGMMAIFILCTIFFDDELIEAYCFGNFMMAMVAFILSSSI